MFETLVSTVLKSSVSTLVKKSISEFLKSLDTHENDLDDIIKELIESISEEKDRLENNVESTQYSVENALNYFKLAIAYDRKIYFGDITSVSINQKEEAILELELRLDTLRNEKDKGIIYNYLANYYKEKDFQKAETYNIKALEYKEKLSLLNQVDIYAKQAEIDFFHNKYEQALKNIDDAITLSFDVPDYDGKNLEKLKLEILLRANLLDNIKERIDKLIVFFKDKNDILQLIDMHILTAIYKRVNTPLELIVEELYNAYRLIEKSDSKYLDNKKIYLLERISILEHLLVPTKQTFEKASKAINLKSLKEIKLRDRLTYLEIKYSFDKAALLEYKKGEYDKALTLYEKSLKITEIVLGENHPDTAISYNDLAVLYSEKNEYDKALPLLKKALEIREKVSGENHRDTASSYNNLAAHYIATEKYDKALSLLEKALKIREKVSGENHRDTATSYNNLAAHYIATEKYDKALPLLKKALEIRETVSGENHPDTATGYNNLAVLYRKKNEYDKALPLFEKSLKIRETVLCENHPDTANSYNHLVELKKIIELRGKSKIK